MGRRKTPVFRRATASDEGSFLGSFGISGAHWLSDCLRPIIRHQRHYAGRAIAGRRPALPGPVCAQAEKQSLPRSPNRRCFIICSFRFSDTRIMTPFLTRCDAKSPRDKALAPRRQPNLLFMEPLYFAEVRRQAPLLRSVARLMFRPALIMLWHLPQVERTDLDHPRVKTRPSWRVYSEARTRTTSREGIYCDWVCLHVTHGPIPPPIIEDRRSRRLTKSSDVRAHRELTTSVARSSTISHSVVI